MSNKKKILKMEHSNYHFEYEDGKEYEARIFRYDEDVTDKVKNNIVMDLFYEILEMQKVMGCKNR